MFDIKSVKSFDIVSFDLRGESKGIGFVINGTPYLLWTHVYQNLEMTPGHASAVLEKLTEGKDNHYISLSGADMKSVKAGFNVTLNLGFNTKSYNLLTEKGYNRIVMEVDTTRMKNKDIAKAIEKRKDEMADVFTQYQNGTLALPDGKKPRSRQITNTSSYSPYTPVLKDNLSACRSIGMDKRAATLTAITLTEKETGKDLSPLKNYCETHYDYKMPKIGNSKNLFSSSAIAEKFGKSSKNSNQFLADNGLLVKIGDAWGLTEMGKKFGEMKATEIRTGNAVTVKYNPRWSSSVIEYLKRKNPVKGQKTLN